MSGPGDDGPLGFGDDHDPDPVARHERVRPPVDNGERRSVLPAGFSRYGWFVGVAAVLFLVIVTVNSLRTDGGSSTGLVTGEPAPQFAAPLALSDLDGDVNVATKAGQGSAGEVPACSIHRRDVVNICDEWSRGPVVLTFFATRGGACLEQMDVVNALARRHPGVRFVGVSIRGDRDDLRALIRERGWTVPIAYDHDGVLANLYGVAVCPQITLLERGGRAHATTLGEIDARALERRVTALAQRRAGAVPPAATTTTTTPS